MIEIVLKLRNSDTKFKREAMFIKIDREIVGKWTGDDSVNNFKNKQKFKKRS